LSNSSQSFTLNNMNLTLNGALSVLRYARALNAGSLGNAKHSEKVGGPLTPASWIEDGEWEARKRKEETEGRVLNRGLAGENVHTAGNPECCPDCGEPLVTSKRGTTCRTKGCVNFNEKFPLDKPENGDKVAP